MHECKICKNNSKNTIHKARETMFGLPEEFNYLKCNKCGCLQAIEILSDYSPYYPNDYYSFSEYLKQTDPPIKRFFKQHRTKALFGKKSLLGIFALFVYPAPNYFSWLKKGQISLDSKVLDVGCGSGHLLIRMKKEGFSQLTGLDAFIEKNMEDEGGLKFIKGELHDLVEQFDFIMLNHSFEHMVDPFHALTQINKILKKDHVALIRIPVMGRYAWRKYGLNWVQLDAPRHIFLHTPESMSLLASQTGFDIIEVAYDSTGAQFWGSEQILQNIPLQNKRSLTKGKKKSIFSSKDLRIFDKHAKKLNNQNDGDQACFYLKKREEIHDDTQTSLQ